MAKMGKCDNQILCWYKKKTQGLYSALKGLKSCDSASEDDNSDSKVQHACVYK